MARASEILAITFTNKAAQEMRDRVELLLGRRTRAMWVMTFHAACARMLRADAHRLGYTRQFTIYDQADARRLVKRCLDELGVDTKRFTPGAVHHQISDAKNKLRDAEAYAELVGSFFETTVADAYRLYERELMRCNAMDFDDLLVRAVNVMELFQEVRDRYSSAFRHVLVDEYQDTNAVQYRWLQLLAGEHRNLAVVGDDAQSIYGFRGADIAQHPELRGRLPRRPRRQARAELPLDADDPQRGERRHRAQPRPEAEVPVDRRRRRRADPHPRARRRARRGALRRRRDRAARRRGRQPRRGRGLLPHERPVPGHRGHARAPRHLLPGHRRHEVLRARRDQGRDRLPDRARQPARTSSPSRGSSTRRGAASGRPRSGA